MNTVIRHNFLLIKRKSILYVFLAAILFSMQIRDGLGTFISVIPTLTFLAALTFEDYDWCRTIHTSFTSYI
jgi:hypothetical protein